MADARGLGARVTIAIVLFGCRPAPTGAPIAAPTPPVAADEHTAPPLVEPLPTRESKKP